MWRPWPDLLRLLARLRRLAALLLPLAVVPAQADEGAPIRTCIYEFAPVVQWKDGKAQGLYVDVLNHVAAQEKWEIRYEFGTWAECLARLKEGKVDLLPSIGYTAERARFLDFTNEYLVLDWARIYQQAGGRLQNITELRGLRVGALKGSIYTKILREMLEQFDVEASIVEYDSYAQVMAAIDKGEIPAGIVTQLLGRILESDKRVEAAPIVFAPIKLLFATTKNRHANLRKTLDYHFREQKQNPASVFNQGYEAWLGSVRHKHIPAWVGYVAAAVVLVLGAMGVMMLALRALVRRRTAQLASLNKELEGVIYIASHDLRSPLINIQGFSDRIGKKVGELVHELGDRRELSGPLQSALQGIDKSLHHMEASIRKMDGLISGLLKISRLGRARPNKQKVVMNVLLKRLEETIHFQLEEVGASLEIQYLPDCVGDEELLSQVFSNLLDNAIKYREPTRPLKIRVSGEATGRGCTYRVEDNGIGIDPAYQGKIWDIFCRLNPRDTPGEGVGLSYSKRVVEAHGGSISVSSRLGGGCIFTIHLPREGGLTKWMQ